MDISNIHIIGTSHVAQESVKEIMEYVESNDIDIVCIELDRERLYVLQNEHLQSRIKLSNISMIKQIGVTGFLFALIAHHVQKKIGKKIEFRPGSDMLSAVNYAQNKGLPVALIDQNVNITLKNLSKKVNFFEKIRILKDLFFGLLGFKSAMMGVDIRTIDFKKVPPEKIITEILVKTKTRYPGLYNVLVESRNSYMVNKIQRIAKQHPDWNILVVVGAGHKDGMIEILEKKTGNKYSEGKTSKKNQVKKDSGIINTYSYSYSTEHN